MSINIQAPSVQDISTTEILQTGITTTKSPIEKDEVQKRLKSFMAAHAQPVAPSPDPNQTENKIKGLSSTSGANTADAPQISASEQQQAVLVKGLGDASPLKLDKRPGKTKTFERVYKTLFHNDSNFFEQDMISLLNALRLKRKSLVDLAPNLSPEQKALRKYLLLETLKEHKAPFVTQEDQKEILVARNKILEDFGDFITGSLGAYNAGIEKKFAGPSLKEFIRAFQVMEIHPNTTSATDLFNLYKTIKKDLQAGAPIEKLMLMQEGFIQVLAREKTQNPARITSTRHHLILSRIKQFGTIITIHALHNQFLKWGQQAGIQGLPNAVSLTETCLQLVFSNETLAGANALVAIASAVRSDRMPAKNAFVSNYCRSVLLHHAINNMYRNANQRKILVEHIERNTQLSAILSPTAR